MKNKISFIISIYLGVVLLLTSACNKEFGKGELLDNKNTIKEKIDTDPNFSFFKELYQFHDSVTNATKPDVITVGTRIPTIGGTLASEGITAYIPTNDVFIANGINKIKVGNALNANLLKFFTLSNNFDPGPISITVLRQFLGNLITNRPAEPADFLIQPRFKTLGGFANDSLFVSNLNGEVLLSFKAKVNLASKTTFKNGNLYTVNNFIPPVYNGQFIQAIATDTTLSLFSQALVRANTPADALINGSANTGTIMATVFAPTNQAFKDGGYTSASINSMPIATLKLLIQNHIIRQRIFSPNLVSGTLTMINNRPITLNVAGSTVTITSPGSAATPATVVNPDLLVIRGVIHKINKVLKP
ncbi:fasciclin domain-containing protein [Pelobium sp.]|nr:fasciclin domain-containing protein [Pelobium sp.]MDA9555460.1 fasciclin domain-containing protein [Pelobium sp.]